MHEIEDGAIDGVVLSGRINRIIKLEAEAEADQWQAAELIAAELADGKSQRQLAREIGKSPMHVNYMNRTWTVNLGVQPEDRPAFNEAYHSPEVRGQSARSLPDGHHATKRFATSGDNEWYSPSEVVDAARRVMGGIDLDPASCAEADEAMQAGHYYTAEQDGLDRANRWKGRVFMNPPYSPSRLCAAFCDRLALEHLAGNVDQAVVLVNNATETKWFQGLSHWATALCIPCRRFKYWKPDGESAGAMQGQAILYLGENAEAFQREFAEFGQVTLLSPEPGEGEDIGDCPGCGAGGKFGHRPGCEASMVPLFTEAMSNLEWAVVRAKVRMGREVLKTLDAEKVVIQLETLRDQINQMLTKARSVRGPARSWRM